MVYRNKFLLLKSNYNPQSGCTGIPGLNINIHNFRFTSGSWVILPGAEEYLCKEHDSRFTIKSDLQHRSCYEKYPDFLKHKDVDIIENREFNYSILKKSSSEKSDSVIFLFHGLNEKYWDKYLPWAEKLVELTNKAVILFPIAFHMNRAPHEWSDPRLMNNVTKARHNNSRSITNSTFANAAISARVEMIPQRFFWSGLQTYYDVIKLIKSIRKGEHSLIASGAKIDLFAYSIGSFLSQILLMSNTRNYFDESKLFIFCGGPTLDRMSPNSKFILDSDATIALYSFYTERLESELRNDRRIAHYFNSDHPAGVYFRSMLCYRKNKEIRENRLRELSGSIYAVALKKDEVIPPNEMLNTLKGDFRDIPVNVEIMDFPFPYSHVTPFPADENIEEKVDKSFNEVFEKAADFFK